MSKNHWETQPRKENGEFTFRDKIAFWEGILKFLAQMSDNPSESEKFSDGSYNSLKKETKGDKTVEKHHMPSANSSPLPYGKGPCIVIDKEDHEETSSYKNSTLSKKYRKQQRNLISQGHFLDAEIMDILDIIKINCERYASAMIEKLEYDKKLYDEGQIDG